MLTKDIHIRSQEYSSADELIPEDRELVSAAIEAMSGAYAPYSHFHVGAAVRLSNGQIVRGANQENAAFPSGLCAERTAMFAAGARYPDKDMLSIAVAGAKSGKPMSVLMVASDKILKFEKVDDILPMIFNCI